MKRQWKIFLITLGSLAAIYFLASATGMLSTATVRANSNEPTLKPRSRIWYSNLVTPRRFDFIIYKMHKGSDWDIGTWINRICGLPGDTIRIIDGVLFVNGKDADASLDLKKDYLLSKEEVQRVGEDHFKTTQDLNPMGNDSFYASLETNIYRSKSLHGRLFLDSSTEGVESLYHQRWTRDNFGPFVVPEGEFFVLGDHRHYAADSRYTGPISKHELIGTVISIHQ